MSSNLNLRQAINATMTAAGAAAFASLAGVVPAMAQQATGPSQDTAPTNALDEVVVTGSRIRRVDAETANPVFVIDSKMIQESGITTVGDLIQRIPSVSGSATNPNVNNGGGFAESCIELRGLDCKRALILVDGRRIGLVGQTSDATDVNQIPINLIDHVEVLKEGAGAIYGSDAIAGVVNFITRKDVNGLEISADYGRTSKNDAPHHSINLLFGTNTDNFSFEAGGNIFQQDGLFGGARAFSQYAQYLYGGTAGVVKGGSSRVPTGRIYSNPLGMPGADGTPCASVTRNANASGAALADYHCYTSADSFNFQPLNYITIPVERSSFFAKTNYKINEDLEAYATVTQTHTHSGFHEAPLPFDSQNDNIVISKNSIYNPFGIDFGGNSGVNPDFSLRTFLFGSRQSDATSDGDIFNGGLKGNLLSTGWTWDFNISYSRLQQHANISGYYFGSKFQDAVGPSFIAADGTPTCGTVATPIAGCTPINVFNQFANSAASLSGISANYNTDDVFTYKAANLDLTGKIITLPAGDLQAAVGVSYDDRREESIADNIVQSSAPLYLTCGLSQETCTGNTEGAYSSKQEYLELLVPILKDLPGAAALNADLGVRHNDYSLFGSSTKADFKVEYRPVKDLLLRGTISQVLRVPTVSDIASPPANTSSTFNDPCNGLTAARVAATPNLAAACVGVPLDGSFQEPNGQITGLNESSRSLKPETGLVKTAGLVFEPSFVPGFSIDATYWSYHINGLITLLEPNYSIQQCVQKADPAFCGLVTRFPASVGPPNAGLILAFVNPTVNLGTLDTSGTDLGLHYNLKDTPFGSFQFSVDWTHTNNYTNTPAPGAATVEYAGTYNEQFGNYTKNRGFGTVQWTGWGADVLITEQFIGGLKIENPSRAGVDANGNIYPDIYFGSFLYTDVTVGYTFPTRTHVQVGIQNLSDKQPPIFYQNNVANVNTDVSTYDVLGRRWFVGFTQKL